MPSNATDLRRSPTPAGTASPPLDHTAGAALVAGDLAGAGLIEEEVLVEEISIDGMCGVY
jgi:mycofactocin precursor